MLCFSLYRSLLVGLEVVYLATYGTRGNPGRWGCCGLAEWWKAQRLQLFVARFSPVILRQTRKVHPGRLTWNIIIEVGKIIFLSKWGIGRFHVNLPGCNFCEKDTKWVLKWQLFDVICKCANLARSSNAIPLQGTKMQQTKTINQEVTR